METIIKIDETGFEINGVRHDHPKPAEAAKTWLGPGVDYFYIASDSSIWNKYWNDTDGDNIRWLTGNCFRTSEEVEECKVSGWWAKRIAQTTIDRFCEDNGIENKWEDDGLGRYIPRLGSDNGITAVSFSGRISTIFTVRTVEDAEKIIAACESEIRLLLS